MQATAYGMTHQNPIPQEASGGLVAAGYITGVLLAPVGFFVGLTLILKNRAGHGVAVMCIAVLVTASLIVMVGNDSPSATLEIAPATPTSATPVTDCVAAAQTSAEINACLDQP